MFPFETSLKILLVESVKSPRQTLHTIVSRFLPQGDPAPQVLYLRDITRTTPLILQIETTNICNAACVFCAYPKMERPKGVMSLPLFERIVDDYASMGGGPVTFTPLVGEVLVDPHLLERLRIIGKRPQINQLSFTTNAIALERFADAEVREILQAVDCIQVSIGGLDPATYRDLYGVDRLPQVLKAVDRLLALKDQVAAPPNINLAFRTNDWAFEIRFRKELAAYRRRGAFVSHIWTYANYSGVVRNDSERNLVVIESGTEKHRPCIYAAMHMAIGWDGRITACGCADFEGTGLRIGQAGETPLCEVWSGAKRQAILDAFAADKLPGICRNCSAYQPDTAIFAKDFCRDIAPHAPLPRGFFQQFWGG